MANIVKKTPQKITLNPIEEADLAFIQDWRNSKNVLPNCRQYRPLSWIEMEKWYARLHNDSDFNLSNDLFIVGVDNIPFGVGGFVRIDWRNRKAELSFYVGEEKFTVYISKALQSLMDYAFKTLNMHKIYFPVYSFNPYLEIYERCLEREYIAKSEYFWNGKWHDRVILVKYDGIKL